MKYFKNTKQAQPALSEAEKQCIVAFNAGNMSDYMAELPKPVEGTCQWILKQPQYVSWSKKEEHALLWITGNPGCGKTILSAFLTNHIKATLADQPHASVCSFFCDDKITAQRDSRAILQGLIHQMLRRRPSLVKYIKQAYENQGRDQLLHSFDALWNIFIDFTKDKKTGPVHIIVDAIDECEKTSRNRFLTAISELFHKTQEQSDNSTNCIKLLITSRPSLSAFSPLNMDVYAQHRLPIEKNQVGQNEDVRLVIRYRVEQIAKTYQCSQKTKEFLEQALSARADQTFLWVKMALQSLEESVHAPMRDLQRIISTLPSDLEAIYETFLHKIDKSDQQRASKILHILVGSWRYLTLDELRIMLAIDPSHHSETEMDDGLQSAPDHTLHMTLGPLVRISGEKVSLVHQSAKDFLLDLAFRTENPLSSIFGVRINKAASIIASCSMSYLLLDEFSVDLLSDNRSNSEPSSPDSPFFSQVDFGDAHNPLGREEYSMLKDMITLNDESCAELTNKYRFYDYAAVHWAEHLSLCEETASQELWQQAIRLTARGRAFFLNWLRYFWYKLDMDYEFPESFDDLSAAAFFGHSSLVQQLLELPESFDQVQKDRALFWASRRGSTSAAATLLQHGADPNSRVVHVQTPLAVAAQYGYLEVVRVLMEDDRTSVNVKGRYGRTPLSFAAGSGNMDVVRLLLNRDDCTPDDADNDKWTPLFWAVGDNHISVVSELLTSNRCDINHADKTGRTVFSWAAGDGLTEHMRLLLKDPRLEPNKVDKAQRSALSWAAGNGKTEAVRILLRSKLIERDGKDVEGRSAISWACGGGHDATLQVLINKGCSGIDEADSNGWTPLAWALNHKSPGTVATLVSSRLVDIEREDSNGRTALSWAAGYGYPEVVKYLLDEGANISSKDHSKRTPLDWAIIHRHVDIIDELERWPGAKTEA